MTKYVGSNQRLDKDSGNSYFFAILGGLIFILGVISQVAPELLEMVMPASDAKLLHDYGIILIVVGMVLELIPIWSKIKQLRAKTTTNTSSLNAQSEPDDMATTVVNYDAVNDNAPLFDNIDSPSVPHFEWSPIKRGGANFKTHKLVTVSDHCMEFHASTGMLLFSIVFAGIGGTVGAVFLFSAQEIIPALIGFLFVGIGIGIYYFASTPRVFEKQIGYYWKGRCKQRELEKIKQCKDHLPLKEIYGLQIVSEYVRGDKSSYHSYELNLVLNSGQRINVIDHGSRKQIEKDAEQLSRFLNVPIVQRT